MTEGPQRPPHPRRDRHVVIVVRHHECVVADASGFHRGREAFRRREHVRRAVGVGQLCVPAQVHRAGDVTAPVLVVAAPVVERTQIPPAVDDPHGRIVEVLSEPLRRHERTERGERSEILGRE